MNTPDGRNFLGYAKSSLAFTHALLRDETDSSSRLIGDAVKDQLRAGGGIYVQAVEGDAACRADAPNAESDSSSFSLMLPSVAERSLVEAVHALVLQMAESNQLLTESMLKLTRTCEQTALALAALSELLEQDDDDEEEDARLYLDGSAM